MKKILTLFSARPHHNIQDCQTPEHRHSYFETSFIPFNNQSQTINQTFNRAINQTIDELNIRESDNEGNENQEEVNQEQSQMEQAQQTAAAAISSVVDLGLINDQIKTVRISLVTEKLKTNKSKLFSEETKQVFKAEVKAKDERFKQVAKTIYMFYTPEDLLLQIKTCSYFRGFKPLDLQHIKKCLFAECEDGSPLKEINKKKSSIQTLKYYVTSTDDGEYHGQMNNNKAPEGQSILYYRNGNIYMGEMKNRFRNGEGRMTYPDGSVYQGSWVLDNQDGQGQEVDRIKGDIFTGTFKNNARHGQGTLQFSKGYRLQGNWVSGYQEGTFVLNVKSQSINMQFNKGIIVEINSIPVSQMNQAIMKQMPNLIQINVNRDNVSVRQQTPTYLTA